MRSPRRLVPLLACVALLAICGGRSSELGASEPDGASDALPKHAPKRLGEMVLIPAGPSVMGYDGGKKFERPQHGVILDAFEIDIYEVTNYEYRRFVRSGEHRAPPHWIDGDYNEGRDFHPVTNVTWEDAVAYATWAGKRLPTEAEWERACRGPKGRMFAYGDTFVQAWTNNGTAPACDTVRVDSMPEGCTPEGCFHMAGNVWEWVGDWFSTTYYAEGQVNPRGPKGGTMRVGKGGSWTTDADVCRASFRCRSLPGARWGYAGFRCARSVRPEDAGTATPWQDMARVPEGEFLMGADLYFSSPPRQIWLDAYLIDKTPVTHAQFARFCRATGYPPPPHWHAGRPPEGRGQHPVNNVTLDDARAYAKWAGKVLATEAQWEKAARGTDGRAYPWGDDYDKALCNTRFSRIGNTVPVGTYPKGASPYGVLGMCGNIWEWVEGRWDPAWRATMPAKNPNGASPTGNLVLRGGTWSTLPNQCRTFSRSPSLRGGRWGYCGFRCVIDARSHPDGLPVAPQAPGDR